MVVDKPGKKYYANEIDWPKRFNDGDLPEDANIDITECVPSPDGWYLAMVIIAYIDYSEGDKIYVSLRYNAADSIWDVGPGWEGETLDIEWEEERGWKVETAWDDGVTDLNELEWKVQSENKPFSVTVETAFEYMQKNGDFKSRLAQ